MMRRHALTLAPLVLSLAAWTAEPVPPAEAFHVGFSGLHAGGLTGLTLLGALEYLPEEPLHPFLQAGVGLSGATVGVGALWSLPGALRDQVESLVRINVGVPQRTGLAPEVVVVQRWRDEEARFDAWRGRNARDTTYIGAQLGVMIGGAYIGPGIYRAVDGDDQYAVLNYGIGF